MDESVFVYVSDSKFLMNSIFQRWLIKTRDYLRLSLLCTLNSFTVLDHFKGRVIALTIQLHSKSLGNVTARCAPEEVTQFSTSITGDRAQILSCRAPWKRPAQQLCAHLEGLHFLWTCANYFWLLYLLEAWYYNFAGVWCAALFCWKCIWHHDPVPTHVFHKILPRPQSVTALSYHPLSFHYTDDVLLSALCPLPAFQGGGSSDDFSMSMVLVLVTIQWQDDHDASEECWVLWTGYESVLHELVPVCLIIICEVWALWLSILQMKTEAKRGSFFFQESSRAETLCLMSHCFRDSALLA